MDKKLVLETFFNRSYPLTPAGSCAQYLHGKVRQNFRLCLFASVKTTKVARTYVFGTKDRIPNYKSRNKTTRIFQEKTQMNLLITGITVEIRPSNRPGPVKAY